MTLLENERIDFVNDDLSLIQKTDGLTFGTDALLLAGYISGKFNYGIELGGGSGIISMLLLTRGKVDKTDALEVQPAYAALIERNAELNGLGGRLFSHATDIRAFTPEKEADIVFTNPPYMKSDSGRGNTLSVKNIARHEICGDIYDFMREGARMLKFGGILAAVYRPDRLADIICAMREARVEPKRLTFVHADEKSEPSMVLIEAKKGAKSSMLLTRPLIIYKDSEHKNYSEDMEYIMENGSFPIFFRKR